jgi:MoaA/NifB/PqqE/SkfB family radical SAM enzyme
MMIQERTQAWNFTPKGEPRGFIEPETLRELWFHTGTNCNLSCSFCLEGSGPGVSRLDEISLEDVAPYLDEAVRLGVERFSFTGGEPFMAAGFPAILEYAASLRPCLVLTNATRPLSRSLSSIAHLAHGANPVSFRVSLDRPDPEQHDAARGKGSFERALHGLTALYTLGFSVSVARHADKGEDAAAVSRRYAALFKNAGLPENLNIVAFPDLGRPATSPEVPQITTDCMTRYHTAESRSRFMCAFSKMIVKRGGKMQVLPCTLVDDDEEYYFGTDLEAALNEPVSLRHHRCFSCFAYGASCSES